MKKTVRIISVILVLLLACAGLIACEHKEASDHTAVGGWVSDATHHWHVCENEKCADAGDKAEHSFDNDCDANCNVCGYERTPAEHKYDNACDTKCNVCDDERTVGAHVYDNACDTKCNVCDDERTVGAHVYDNACDTACNVCGATRTITHDHATTLTSGDTTHYYACAVCGDKKDEAAHVFDKTVASNEYLKAAATATTKAQYYKSCVCGKASATEYFETDKTEATLSNIQDLSKTYDNVELANPTYTTNSDGAVTIEWYQGTQKLDAKPVNAGTYKVKVIVAETATYAGVSAEKEFTISKKATTFTTAPAMTSDKIIYGDVYGVNYTTDGDGDITIEYKVKDADDATYTTVAPTNKGIYTARVSVAEGTNYKAKSETVDFEIAAYAFKNVTSNINYNGTNVYDYDVGHIKKGVRFIVTFASKNVGAAVTSVEVLLDDNITENYTVDIDTFNLKIKKKTVRVEWTAPSNLVYDGTEKIPTATLTGVLAGDDCTVGTVTVIEGDNVGVGTFKCRATSLSGEDAGNYELPLNNTYKTSPEYTITPHATSNYSGSNGYFAGTLNTEATPVVFKITHVGTSNALTRMRFYQIQPPLSEELLTDFTVTLYDESFTQIAVTYDNETGRFIKSDSSAWSLAPGQTCYVVLKTANATNNVRLVLFNN